MKSQATGTMKSPCVTDGCGAEAARCLQEELVAAIHGAFEVAVQIAVREVKKLVGPTAGHIYEEMRRENASLKARLQSAEAMLESQRVRERRGSPRPPKQHLSATKDVGQLPNPSCNRISSAPEEGDVHTCREVRGDAPVSHSSAGLNGQPQGNHEEQGSGDKTQLLYSEEELNNGCTKDVTEEVSRVCVVKVESIHQSCQEESSVQGHHSAAPTTTDERSTSEQVIVKQETPEDEQWDASACCLDSIKVEDFSLDCMSAIQSKMSEWEPELPGTQSQDSNIQVSCTRLVQAPPPNVTTGLPPPPDLPSLSSEFPIFQLAEAAPVPETRPQIYGVHIQGSRNLSHTISNVYTCKFCGQTFHLPSLLRRHYNQCQQKLQQRSQQPMTGERGPDHCFTHPAAAPSAAQSATESLTVWRTSRPTFAYTRERDHTPAQCA
ncbi:hypothetical protein INR49_026453 [Caranx melampygus]|nr:hypothetical protein INR49_026453 [Caranx melampygus]